MYEYLKGVITTIAPKFIVLDVSGIGYRVVVSNPYSFVIGQTEQVFIEQIVRQDDITLYGFKKSDEKVLFQKLLDVSGIGPKSALAILVNADHSGLIKAIINGDVAYLVKFPGIGKKTAQQIVLDLQNNIAKLPFDLTGIDEPIVAPKEDNLALSDALEALQALGYGQREVEKIEKKLIGQPDLTTAEYVSAGLKLLV
ncbi:Holliday junction branch migration protein RuvA [Weissella diestrammenae]|uniref:Holliday junction branch migration complex subunit RuvA n=1 Tax=Weissella diestrammenae TaxID=1162633 RepID=A0A7G9T4Y5_9LACO|nr:Holliday junction branch migration protein RuvA [Weissella diestrammenae]MCM0582881.1 Holliday junction branch migration protein RuvA [Weissella diestrammenae]QNN75160.1 Holliday junction branch migration protein RuvA [Weissella diestrammenae]